MRSRRKNTTPEYVVLPSATSRAQLNALTNPEEYVLAPGGYRHHSLIKKVPPPRTTPQGQPARKVINKTATVKERYASRKIPAFTPLHSNRAIIAAPLADINNPFWVAYSSWVNTTGRPVFSIKASWEVPQPPLTDNEQTIFIFPGIQSTQRIVQPVLQWGKSAAGGGSFWGISSWYAGDPDSKVKCSTLVPVNAGDTVTGVISLNAISGNRFTYSCAFEGQDATILPVPPIAELLSVCLTLEAYNIFDLTDYPQTDKTIMSSIEVNGKSAPMPVVWETPAPPGQFGEHALIIPSPGNAGDVELFY